MLVYSDVGFIYTTCISYEIVLISYAIYVPGIFLRLLKQMIVACWLTKARTLRALQNPKLNYVINPEHWNIHIPISFV